jgi:two-component system OmpR family sensor kinase
METVARRAARRFGPRSFRGTIVASTVGLMTVSMVVVGLFIQLLLSRAADNDVDEVLHQRADTAVAVIRDASATGLTVPEDGLEPGIVVYDSDGAVLAGSVGGGARDLADALAGELAGGLAGTAQELTRDGPGGVARLLAVPFDTPSGESGVLVVSQDTTPYERSERYALYATGVLAALVIATTALFALRVTRQALEPVAQMAQRAAEWSEHDLTSRFALGPPTNELAALGETLDHLLDRVASAILSEQRLTAELAHELRTPLTSIQGSADLALLRGVPDPATRQDLEQISASAHEMTAVITTLLDLARDESPSSRRRTCTVADLVPALVAAAGDTVPVDDRTGPSSASIAAPRDLVVRAIVPLIGNAVQHARSGIRLTAVDRPDTVELTVSDDGPGVADERREDIFEPGVTYRDGGAGLGLGIARRVARSFGGEITLAEGTDGACFAVSMPRR